MKIHTLSVAREMIALQKSRLDAFATERARLSEFLETLRTCGCRDAFCGACRMTLDRAFLLLDGKAP